MAEKVSECVISVGDEILFVSQPEVKVVSINKVVRPIPEPGGWTKKHHYEIVTDDSDVFLLITKNTEEGDER